MKKSRTLSATICTSSSGGPLSGALSRSTAITSWTQHTYIFTAATSTSMPVFVVQTNTKWTWILDDISMTDTTSTELLINGDFENGSLSNGWLSYSCAGTVCPSLVTGPTCHGGSGSYYSVPCSQGQTLQQPLATVAGQTYTFSFWAELFNQGPGNGPGFSMSFDII